MTERETLLDLIDEAQQRKAALGTFDDGLDEFEKAERLRLYRLDEAALAKERSIAAAEWLKIERARRRFAIVREVAAERGNSLSAQIGDDLRKAATMKPAELVIAERDMTAEVEMCRKLGFVERTWGQVPGGPLFLSPKNRTAADDARQARTELALRKLNALLHVRGDLRPLIAAIWTELREANDAAQIDPVEVAKKNAPSVVRENENAELVLD